MDEDFTLHEALHTIDAAVRAAAAKGPVVLVGHSMGGLLCLAYVGGEQRPPVAALVAASCTSLPHGAGLRAYRLFARAVDSLPDRGMWLTGRVLEATIPPETRSDFAAGGYALDMQDTALRSLAALDIAAAVPRITVPLWFVNGQYDQLRLNESLFRRLAPHAELVIVPRTTHLVTAMRPRIFNAVLQLAIATVEEDMAGS
ncbi:alpha/beta fold hydrolase [Microbacterium paraoxydans]|uniref:alpha/beta fold hydrolase n=1 Tax=Microbacterium paraoxydans TaxID=199592 RepID=UPI0027E15649|nr:alpha/beta hydrolase [Microbacterium paraoxydans]